ncbi:MAG: prenyltransferase [Acidobacteria bacterium 13_1_20CM_3_53_8]|nr:MAG: prenyltransferase [Acidobacteria bacterium 13_1_20CM_3_53_8]
MRPRQWVKNGFVLMGVLFANVWRDPLMLRRALLVFVAFSLVASGVYIINDFLDRENDLNHPRKRFRPLASKAISVSAAFSFMIILWLVGFLLGIVVSNTVLFILLIYVAINLAYSLGLKHVVLLDVFIIAGGFMLRILAGTSGIGIAPSQWLMLCGLMTALFLGFAKRRAELYALSNEKTNHRRVLEHYSPVLLDKMIVVTATCVILCYSLYTMSPVTIQTHHTESLVYTVPFVLYGIFRYLYTLHIQQTGTDPAQELFRDPHILVSILGWLLLTLWLISPR